MTPENLPPYDVATDLAHRLIRDQTKDLSDPFMVHGHPCLSPGREQVVRACFYYAVTCSPKLTILHDNWGEGGMCKMVPDEWRAIWRTPDLLQALGCTYEQLRDGTAQLSDAPIPAPAVPMEQLTDIVDALRHGAAAPEPTQEDLGSEMSAPSP